MKVVKLNEDLQELVKECTESEDIVKEEVDSSDSNDFKRDYGPAIKAYREYAQLGEDVEIKDESEIDDWALTEASEKYKVSKYDLRHKLLGEDATLGQAARELEAQKEVANTKSEIERVLDEKLEEVKEMGMIGQTSGYPALLLEGEAGVGKTAIVNQWCNDNGLHIHVMDLASMSPEALMGIVDRHPDVNEFVIRKISTELLIPLSKPNTVLFIDEYNRGRKELRNALLNLVINHKMSVPMVRSDFEESKKIYAPYGELQPNGQLFFPNLLFVVCAQNPYGHVYSGTQPLDAAEASRLELIKVPQDKGPVLSYFTKKYTSDIEKFKAAGSDSGVRKSKGRLAIAQALLNSDEFYFDTAEEREELHDENPSFKELSPRSLETLLQSCNGTKDSFLDKWNRHCNYKKKAIAEHILEDFVDVDDEANAALATDSDSNVFAKRELPSLKLKKLLGIT